MNLPKTLINKLSEGHVIPLIGAGVSMSIRDIQGERVFPSWSGLLKNAATKVGGENNTKAEAAINLLVDMGELHTAAEMAKKALPSAVWYEFLSEQFNPSLEQLDSNSANLQRAIWKISNRIITLNYDKCLTWAHKSPASVIRFDNSNNSSLRNFKANNTNEDMIWHLHGYIDHPENIILTPESYKSLYAGEQKNKNSAAISTLRDIFSTESILFVGSSLADVELLEELNNQHKLFSENTGPHYALVKESEIQILEERISELSKSIQLIPFKDFGGPLEDLLSTISFNSKKNEDKNDNNTQKININSDKDTVSVLISNPLDYQNNYDSYIKSLKKFKSEIDIKPLNSETLWDDSDYIFILSKWTKNGIQIEDDACCRDFLDIEELCDCLPFNAKGIFIILDNIPDFVREIDLENITDLPILIMEINQDNKNSIKKLDQLYHQVFKKNNIKFIPGSVIINEDSFNYDIRTTNSNKIKYNKESKLNNIEKSSVSNFIGRSSDLAAISRELVRIEDKGLVLVIKGSGGIGKTTIINKLSVELSKRDKYNGGIHFIDCEPISDFNQFHHKLSSIFDLQSAQNLIEHLSSYFDDKKRLIVIDNFESILNLKNCTDEIKCKFLSLIGELSDFSSIIITSRESSGESWEEEFVLRSLESEEALILFNKSTKNKYSSPREQLYIKNKIIEEQLDRNPLAIKLIASNIPPGKDIFDLENDLQDLFSSVESIEYFNHTTDNNINRKNSLLGSVIYSYQTLNSIDQKAIELISFFPDGISLNSLKKLANNRVFDKQSRNVKSLITDNSIKTLSNKSLIMDSNHTIKLHPIINRFVFIKANQNSDHDFYWQNIADYNIGVMSVLDEMKPTNLNLVLDITLANINNFLLLLEMTNKINFSLIKPEDYLEFLDSLSSLTTLLSLSKSYAQRCEVLLEKTENADTNCNFIPQNLLTSLKLQHAFSLYFGGEFKNAFELVKSLYPFENFRKIDSDNRFDYIDSMIANCIYSMEGYTSYDIEYLIMNKNGIWREYPSVFYEKCIFHLEFLNLCDKDLPYYESQRILNTIDIDDLKERISSLHPNQHLDRCQLSYILHLLSPLSDAQVKKLVSVNPFTSGLKSLMLASNLEKSIVLGTPDSLSTIEKVESLYLKASKQLFHIKYFFIHSQYQYCKFLSKFGDTDRFLSIKEKAHCLSKEYEYPYWIHIFDNFPKEEPFDFDMNYLSYSKKYDIESVINTSLKTIKRHKNEVN